MSKNNVFWGKPKSEVVKEKKIESQIEELEAKKEELEASVDQMLTKTGPFNPTHKAYSLILRDRKWQIIEVDIDLDTLQSKANLLESKYDGETSAISQMNRLLSEQSKRILSKK